MLGSARIQVWEGNGNGMFMAATLGTLTTTFSPSPYFREGSKSSETVEPQATDFGIGYVHAAAMLRARGDNKTRMSMPVQARPPSEAVVLRRRYRKKRTARAAE